MKKELKIKWNMLISTAVMGTLNSPQLELLNIKPHKVIKKITSAFRLSDAIFKDESVVDMDSLLQAISADPHKAFDVLKDFELIDGFPEESTKNAIRLSIDKHPFLISLELDGFGGPFSFLFSENFKRLTNFENVDFVKIFMNNMISQSRVHGYSRMIIHVDSESVKFVPETEWQKEFIFLIISALQVIEQLTARHIDIPACIPYPNEDLESMTFDRLKKLMLREDELSENEEFVKLSNIKETLANLYAFRIRHLVSDSYNHINEERLKLGEDLRRNKRIAKGIKMHCAKLIEDLEIKNSDLSLLTQADLDALSKHEVFGKLELREVLKVLSFKESLIKSDIDAIFNSIKTSRINSDEDLFETILNLNTLYYKHLSDYSNTLVTMVKSVCEENPDMFEESISYLELLRRRSGIPDNIDSKLNRVVIERMLADYLYRPELMPDLLFKISNAIAKAITDTTDVPDLEYVPKLFDVVSKMPSCIGANPSNEGFIDALIDLRLTTGGRELNKDLLRLIIAISRGEGVPSWKIPSREIADAIIFVNKL